MNKKMILFALGAVLSSGAMANTYLIDLSANNYSCTSDNPNIKPEPLKPADMPQIIGSPETATWVFKNKAGVEEQMNYSASNHKLVFDKTLNNIMIHEIINTNFIDNLNKLTLTHFTLQISNFPISPTNYTITCEGPLVYNKSA